MADGNLPDLSDLGVPATLSNTKPRLSPQSSAKIAASKVDLSDLAGPPAPAKPQQPSPLDRLVRGFKGETPNAPQPPTAVAAQPTTPVAAALSPSPRVTTPPVTPQKPAVSPVPNVTTPPATAVPPAQPLPQPPVQAPAPAPVAAAPAKPPVPGNLSLADVQNPKPAPGAPLPPAGGLGTGADRPGIDPRLQPIIDAATKLSQQRGTAPVLDGLTKGIQSGVEQANRDLGYPGATQAPEKPPPEAEPISPADILDLNKLLPKVGYMIGHGYPQLAGGAVGAAAGGAVGGPPGAVVGAGAGFAAATFAQTLRPAMEAAIKQGMSPDDAFKSALTEAGKSAAWSGVAGLAFGFAPFGSLVKDILFQSLGIQPGIAVAETISNNIAAGKDPLEGTDQAALSAMFGTLVPAAVMHAVLRPPAPPKAEPAAAEAGAPPPGPGFDQAQREASANRPPPASGANAEVEGWVTAAQQATAGVGPDNLTKLRDFYGRMLKAKGWSDADANDLLSRVFTEAAAPTQGAPPTALPPPGGAEAAPAAGARPETPQAAPADVDTAALKAAGFADDEIARMDPQARQVALETLRGMPGAQATPTPPEAVSKSPEAPSKPAQAAAQPSVIVAPPPRAPANATPEQAAKSAVDFINADPNLTPEDKAAFNAVIPGVIYGTDQTKPAEAAPDTTGQRGQDVAAGRNRTAVEEPQGSRDAVSAGGGAVAKTEVAPEAAGTRYGGPDNRTGGQAAEPAHVQADLAKPEVAAALNRPVTVDRSYDIPYLAGYSEDGKTIFIDRHLPQKLTIAGKEIDPTEFLQRHETVEKALIDALNHTYQGAHEIATGAEHAALVAAGIDPAAYEAALKPYIKTAEHKTLTRVPANLDLTPYDDTNATAIKARMAKAKVAPKASEAATSAAMARLPKREKGGKPASLVRFLASHGGIRDFKGELGKGLSIGKHFVPGYGKLVRPNGMTLDHAREIAAEAGYLGGNQGQAMAETTIDDLLQALDEEINRSRPVISAHDEQGKAEQEAAQATKAHADAKREIVAALKASGGKTTDTGFIDHAADLLARGKAGDVESALERAALELADQDATPQERAAYDAIVPGWETAADEGAARAAGERGVEPPQAGQDTGTPTKAVGGREPVSDRAAGEKSELASKVERGADNKDQFVLPGAERISDAELAKRRAAQALKPRVAQKPADEDLFSDEGQQSDLVDMAKRKGGTEVGSILSRLFGGGKEPAPEAKPAEKPVPPKEPAYLPRGDGSVADYVKRLDAARFDEQAFPVVFKELQDDAALKAPDFKAIAKEFTGAGVASKTEALNKIFSRHRSILMARAKSRATSGRSAANIVPRETPETRKRAALERALSAIVKRVAGKDVEVSFEPIISAVEAGDAAYNAAMGKYQEAGGKLSKTAGGSARMRLDGTALIRIAMNDPGFNPTDSAYHEAYHRVEAQLMTDAEYAAVNSEEAVAEARRMAAEVVGRDPNGPEMRDLPGYEARAIAFEGYAKGWEAKGILPALGRFFARLARLLREVRALLTRMKVRSLRDVFGDVYAGKMAEREPGFRDVTADLRDVASAVDRSGVDQMPRTELGSRVSREQRRAVKSFVHDQEDALFRISTNSQADVADMRERLGDLPKAYTGDADEKFYRHVEDQKGVPLTPTERALYNETVAPLKKMEQQAYVEARTLGQGQTLTAVELDELGNVLDPEYMHRMVQGKTPQFDVLQGREASGNPIFSGRSLSKSTSSLKSPTYYAIEGENGARRVVSKGSEGINVWGKNKPTPLKGTNAKTSLKMGDRFKIGGQMWSVTRARTPEIEAATPTRYYQSAFANTVDNILRLRRVVRALKYVDELKHTPEWGEMSVPMDEHHPSDWKMVDAPGLRGFWLDPRIANPINDFLEGGARIWKGDLAEKIEKVNRLAVGSLFWSPIPHAMNVGAHWFVARGWDWLTPTGWYSTVVDGVKALKSTVTQDARYRDYLRSGASLIGSRVTNRNFVEAMLTKVGWQIERERNKFQKIADILGYQHVEDLIRSYYKGVSTILWMSNDVFMLQRIMELERKAPRSAARAGTNSGEPTTEDARQWAIREAGAHIPDYRLPSTIMGSRAFSEVMQDPNLFMFSRYHYGIFRAYAETIKGLVGKGKSAKERFDALGKLLALGVLVFMIYPLLDNLAKAVTGDKKAKAIRRGPATFPQNLIDWKAGNKNWLQVMLSFMSPSPVLLEAEQQAFNADLYLSQYGPGVGVIQKKNDDLWKAALHRLQHVGGTIPLGGQVQTALNPKKGVDNVLLQQIGVSVP